MKLDFLKGLSDEQLSSCVGNYLIPVETSFDHDETVGELLKSLQGKQIAHEARYFYAVDQENRLKGIVATRDILFSTSDVKLSALTNEKVASVNEEAPLKEALRVMAKYKLMALPLVDHEGHLKGIIDISSSVLASTSNSRNSKDFADVFQLIGLTVEQGNLTSSTQEFRYRMPWLTCNIAAGLICAGIAAFFYELLEAIVVISMFIPLVLTLAESVSMQSMTLSLQFLHFGVIPWNRVKRRIIVEFKTAALLGITCAACVCLFYIAWFSGYWPMMAIAVSIILSVLASTLFGSLLPVVLHAFSLDPKVASGPVVLMLTDVTATTVYYGFSSWLLI